MICSLKLTANFLRVGFQVACNIELIAKLDGFAPLPGIRLSLHTGIGAGRLNGYFVGGMQNKWEYFVAGQPIEDMSAAGEEAVAGFCR